jgi:solute carrier family 35 (adenosine 3'-phospho 5'-phosphosulfate transporter), member B3
VLFLVGCRYSVAEYASAVLLVVGITLFTLADKELPSFDVIGVLLVTLGVVADAITCNFEERRFFKGLNCSQAEVVLFSSAFGSLFSIGTIGVTGELASAMLHASSHPGIDRT